MKAFLFLGGGGSSTPSSPFSFSFSFSFSSLPIIIFKCKLNSPAWPPSSPVVPSPTNLQRRTTDDRDIIVSWSEPETSCAFDKSLSYHVYWQKILLFPAAGTDVTIKSCAPYCSCAYGQAVADSESKCQSLDVQVGTKNHSLLLRFGFQGATRNTRALIFSEAFHLSSIPMCEVYNELNANISEGCCRNGVGVRLGKMAFNDTGIFTNAQEEVTNSLNFTIRRSQLDDFSLYAITVRCLHWHN